MNQYRPNASVCHTGLIVAFLSSISNIVLLPFYYLIYATAVNEKATDK